MSTIEQKNAKLFEKFLARSGLTFADLKTGKFEVEGFIPLNLDVLYQDGERTRLSLAHNTILEGDVMCDPDMEFWYYPTATPTLRACTFQNSYTGTFTSTDEAGDWGVEDLRRDLNLFASTWLQNLLDQGHKLVVE